MTEVELKALIAHWLTLHTEVSELESQQIRLTQEFAEVLARARELRRKAEENANHDKPSALKRE